MEILVRVMKHNNHITVFMNGKWKVFPGCQSIFGLAIDVIELKSASGQSPLGHQKKAWGQALDRHNGGPSPGPGHNRQLPREEFSGLEAGKKKSCPSPDSSLVYYVNAMRINQSELLRWSYIKRNLR